MAKALSGQIGSNPPRVKPTEGRSDAPKWPIWRVAEPLDGYLAASTDEDLATVDSCHRLLAENRLNRLVQFLPVIYAELSQTPITSSRHH